MEVIGVKQINIARSILELRRAKGLTQDELASYLGVSKAAVSKWETGQSYPDILLLPQLATYFSISIDELIGYEPQLSKADIRDLYQELAAAFASRSFEVVMAEVDEVVKKYYSCYPLLLQMTVLLLNHVNLAEPDAQLEILEQAKTWCQRIKEESADVALTRRANSLEATLALLENHPGEVIDLLSDLVAEVAGQEEILLASAYQNKGDAVAARRILQIGQYQNVLGLISSAASLLPLYCDDRVRFDEVLNRGLEGLEVAQAYDLAHLQPNAIIQLTVAAARLLTGMGEHDRAVEMLEQVVAAYQNFGFPLLLHGDDYFDLLDDWFEELDLGTGAPRDEKLVKQSLQDLLSSQVFAPLSDRVDYKNLLVKAARI